MRGRVRSQSGRWQNKQFFDQLDLEQKWSKVELSGFSQIMVLHIPHSSRVIPVNVRHSLLLSDIELETELIRMTDSFTDELFDCASDIAIKIISPVSRLVVDVSPPRRQ